MAVKKIEELNIHRDVNSTEQFDVQGYLNENWDKMQDVVDNNAEELMQVQKDISTLKEDNKTNKSSIDVLEKSNETRDGKISKNTEDIEAIQGSIKTATETINKKDNEQDEDIKANKESIEELQAENLEIKAENERLREDIKSIATIGEASGENIHIEDSSNARCEIEIGGNHQQDTREGYNKLDSSEFINSTQNGVTLKVNLDGTLTLNGTATADTTFRILRTQKLIVGKENLKVIINQLENAIKTGTIRLVCQDENYENTIYSQIGTSTFYNNLKEGITYNIFSLTISSGTICNNLKLGLVISEDKTDYEQYGASPSLDYPSSVKAVGKIKNILDMSNAKNGASAGIICTTNADGSYKYKGTATSQYINVWFMGGYATDLPTLFTLEPGTYYINDVSLFEGTTGFANDSSKKIWTFIRAYNVTGVRAPNAISGNTYDETKYPIVAKIDHEIPWVPYNYGSAKIDIFNKNYLSKIPKTSVTAQGITSTFDGEKFICKGTAQTNYFNLFTEKVYKKISKGIKTFSTNKLKKGRAFIHFDYVDGTGQNYYTSINTNQVRFTLNKDVKSYRLNVDSITAGDTIDDNIYVQLEDGNIATEIEKAENQEYLVDVQQEMLKGDTFVRQDGKWYEKHCWKKIMVDGENVFVNVVGVAAGRTWARINGGSWDNSKDVYSTLKKIKCTHFRVSDSWKNNTMYGKNTSVGMSFQFMFDNNDLKTVNDVNKALKELYEAGTPVIIYYKLAEPKLLECTETQSKELDEIYNKAHTYKNITNISAESAEINPIVNVKYLKDTETEHNKLQAQINEIKQLLSTTETSALLVNNLEKDLRMEVE